MDRREGSKDMRTVELEKTSASFRKTASLAEKEVIVQWIESTITAK